MILINLLPFLGGARLKEDGTARHGTWMSVGWEFLGKGERKENGRKGGWGLGKGAKGLGWGWSWSWVAGNIPSYHITSCNLTWKDLRAIHLSVCHSHHLTSPYDLFISVPAHNLVFHLSGIRPHWVGSDSDSERQKKEKSSYGLDISKKKKWVGWTVGKSLSFPFLFHSSPFLGLAIGKGSTIRYRYR